MEWCDSEGLAVVGGYGVEDLRALPLTYWERLGGAAAYCHLEGVGLPEPAVSCVCGLQAKHICHSEAKPKNLHGLTETLRSAQGDSLRGGFEGKVGFQPT